MTHTMRTENLQRVLAERLGLDADSVLADSLTIESDESGETARWSSMKRLPSGFMNEALAEAKRRDAGETASCDHPDCDQMAVALLANDAPLTSAEYAERQVCRWHRSNAFPTDAGVSR